MALRRTRYPIFLRNYRRTGRYRSNGLRRRSRFTSSRRRGTLSRRLNVRTRSLGASIYSRGVYRKIQQVFTISDNGSGSSALYAFNLGSNASPLPTVAALRTLYSHVKIRKLKIQVKPRFTEAALGDTIAGEYAGNMRILDSIVFNATEFGSETPLSYEEHLQRWSVKKHSAVSQEGWKRVFTPRVIDQGTYRTSGGTTTVNLRPITAPWFTPEAAGSITTTIPDHFGWAITFPLRTGTTPVVLNYDVYVSLYTQWKRPIYTT